jgi:hypothetical protein
MRTFFFKNRMPTILCAMAGGKNLVLRCQQFAAIDKGWVFSSFLGPENVKRNKNHQNGLREILQ